MKKIEKLIPAFKSIIWGGDKLKRLYNKHTDLYPLAESWELSMHHDGECTFEDGTPLSSVPAEQLGENCKDFPTFPVLVKLIDANAKLSVQVHPNDEYALSHENSLGKTEMWYIVDADDGAGIYLGFKKDISREQFEKAIKDHTLTDLLNFIPVKKGECYFIPSRTIHAICEGCLICEIQQNSNITYRVYDYGRIDKNGKERELHIEKALDVTNTSKYEPMTLSCETKNGKLLGISRFFTATYISSCAEMSIDNDKRSFRCITCLDGEGYVGDIKVVRGDSVFIPADFGEVVIKGDMSAVMTSIRKYYASVSISDKLIRCAVTDDNDEVIATESICCSDKEDIKEKVSEGLDKVIKKCGLMPSDICAVYNLND